MASLLFFCKAPMNAVMFARPLRRMWGDPKLDIRFAGEGRGHGGAVEIVRELGFEGAQRASAVATRWRAWDAYVSPDIHMPARRARRRVQIFHGVSFKGKMFTPAIRRFSDLFLIGEDMRRRFMGRGLFEEGDVALHQVGMPKLDALFDGSLDRTRILADLGADADRPAVLYAPTWRPESSLYARGGLEFIRKASSGVFPFILIVKLHDWHWDASTNPINWKEAMAQLQNEHVRFAPGADATPYLYAADALISDASSVANEYLLLDRPIIWIDVPELIKKYEQTIDLEGWGRKTGRIVKSPGELEEAVAHALCEPGEFSGVRRGAANDIFYHPGKATGVFEEKLRELIST